MPKPKIVVILGPTSSGKSALAVRLARKFNGEIVSADSRQVYRNLNLGSGKITRKEMSGVPHHLLDVVSPKGIFSVARYQKLAMKTVKDILRRGKLPIICGGTGLYIDSLLYGYRFPDIKPDYKLRLKLEKQTAKKLFDRIKKLDPVRAKSIDQKNKRRLVRALEIILSSKKPVPQLEKDPLFDALKIGLLPPTPELRQKVEKRLKQRLKAGLIAEIKRLHKNGLSFKRLENLGLECRFVSLYLRGLINREKMEKLILKSHFEYIKRQLTWWRKDKNIVWLTNPKKYYSDAARKIIRFLSTLYPPYNL
jgi:tRNA dimethylallyltransferase